MRAIVEGLFDPAVCTRTKIAVWFAFFGDSQYRAVYRSMVGQSDTERSDVIEALCRSLAEEGGYPNIDAHGLAQSIESLADGLWLSLLLYPNMLTPAAAIGRMIDLLADKFPAHFDPPSAGG